MEDSTGQGRPDQPQIDAETLLDIGIRLRVARRSAGLSQVEAAERSGMSVATLSRLERGIAKLYQWQLRALAKAYGVGADNLTHGEPLPAPELEAGESKATEQPPPHVRQYKICPSCGQDGLAPDEVVPHLMSRQCSTPHNQAQAVELASKAVTDPHPWAFVVARYERQLEAAKRAARFRIKGREHWRNLIAIVETSLDRALRMGPEAFYIRNPALDDPYFIRQAGMAEQLDWAATISRALELQEEIQGEAGGN